MEQDIIKKWADEREIDLDPSLNEKLHTYADLICQSNKKFNITGKKTSARITETLIIGSIDPILNMPVPRGTYFVDIGSGAGIPGIIIGMFFKGVTGLLVESNHKKAAFIQTAIEKLCLDNLTVACDRAESLAREAGCLEMFDYAFTRAFGHIYLIMEIVAPLLKINGILYSYSEKSAGELHEDVFAHAGSLGLSFALPEAGVKQEPPTGILAKKERRTPRKFPRRFAVIKREAKRIDVRGNNA